MLRVDGLLIVPCISFLLSVSLFAETITGTVINGTTHKPAVRAEVVLTKLSQGMEEAARTRTDASGRFSFHLPDTSPYLIRAIHQGVPYHRMIPPGTSSVELQVFDVSKNVEGVSVTADVMRFQAQGSELQGISLAKSFNTDRIRCFDFWRLDDQKPYRAAINAKLRQAAERWIPAMRRPSEARPIRADINCCPNSALGTATARTWHASRMTNTNGLP